MFPPLIKLIMLHVLIIHDNLTCVGCHEMHYSLLLHQIVCQIIRMNGILGSQIKSRKPARVVLVPWNILPYKGGADPKCLGISMVYGRAVGTTTS